MFKKYDINDLYLAEIECILPKISNDKVYGYSYETIIYYNGKKYIDLENPSNKLEKDNSNYKIIYIEPLSHYYTNDGKKKKHGRIKPINTNEMHYEKFYHNYVKTLIKK